MSTIHYFQIIKNRWRAILVLGLGVALAALLVSAAMPRLYRSSVQLVVVQKFGYPVDIYTATKSTQYVSTILKNIIYSRSVMDIVIESTGGFKNQWNTVPEKRKALWAKRVKTRVVSDTGIVNIEAYDEDARQAERLVSSITGVLIADAQKYIGGSGEVTVKVLDSPVTSSAPVLPNIPLNTVAGFVVGILLGVGYGAVAPPRLARTHSMRILRRVAEVIKKFWSAWMAYRSRPKKEIYY